MRCPPTQELLDLCVKETVLRALSGCKKGRRKFDVWLETPNTKRRRQSRERGPSASSPYGKLE